LKTWLKELRAEFLPASILPVLVAGSLAYYEEGTFDAYLFSLTLLGVAFMHLGTNVANDYYDHISGNDILNKDYVRPFTGGSRLIQEGMISPRAVLATAVSFFAAATIVGIFLFLARGPAILVLGIAGIISGFFYTAPPFRFGYRGFGAFLIGLNFGVLITCGAYYVQTGTITPSAFIASLPLAFLISAVVIINEFQDANADARVGKRTIVVRMGKRKAVKLLAVVSLAAFVPVIAGVSTGLLPPFILISLAAVFPILKAINTAKLNYNRSIELAPANASIIMSHTLMGILMVIGTVLSF